MAIQLVISDFDRTFTDSSLAVDPGLARAIRRVREKGVHFSIISGRNYDFLEAFCDTRGGLIDAFVAENGCIGRFDGKKYILGDSSQRQVLLHSLEECGVPYGHGEVIVAVDARHENALSGALSELNGAFHVIKNVDSLMILPAGVSKASGAAWLASMYGLGREETAGIGDAENDVILRDACGLLGAVRNAIPAMKDAADYVCREDYGRGLEEFLVYLSR